MTSSERRPRLVVRRRPVRLRGRPAPARPAARARDPRGGARPAGRTRARGPDHGRRRRRGPDRQGLAVPAVVVARRTWSSTRSAARCPAPRSSSSRRGSLRDDLLRLLTGHGRVRERPAAAASCAACSGRRSRSIRCSRWPAAASSSRGSSGCGASSSSGIERGEARPGAATRTLAQVGPAVVLHRFLLHGRVTADDVREIVDEVVLPLLRVRSLRARRADGPAALSRRAACIDRWHESRLPAGRVGEEVDCTLNYSLGDA